MAEYIAYLIPDLVEGFNERYNKNYKDFEEMLRDLVENFYTQRSICDELGITYSAVQIRCKKYKIKHPKPKSSCNWFKLLKHYNQKHGTNFFYPKDLIVKEYLEIGSFCKTADKLGISESTIKNVVTSLGYYTKQKGWNKNHKTYTNVLCNKPKAYWESKTFDEIQEEVGCGKHYLRFLLCKKNIVRKETIKSTLLRKFSMLKKKDVLGKTVREIANEYNMSYEYANRLLNKYNLPFRRERAW